MKPQCLYSPLQNVKARIGGSPARKKIVMRIPGASRTRMFFGSAWPSHETQKYSDRLTLESVASLWTSQFSKGPKKFQFGPRRNVPIAISEIQRIRKPNMKVPTARGRSFRV